MPAQSSSTLSHRTQHCFQIQAGHKIDHIFDYHLMVTGQIYFTKEHFQFICLFDFKSFFTLHVCLRIFFCNSKYFIRYFTQFGIICINNSLLNTATLLSTKVKYKR